MVRVLFSSTWGYGHVFPMIPLAQACLAAGHDVLWASNEPARPLVQAAQIPFAAAGLTAEGVRGVVQRNRSHHQRLAPQDRAAFAFPHMFGAWATPAMTADLLPLASAWRPDVLVHEAAELASPLVGSVLGVPSVTHSFGGAVPPQFLTEAGHRLASLWSEHGQSLPPYAGCLQSVYLDICPASVQTSDLSHVLRRQPLKPVSWTGPPPAQLPPYLHPDERALVYLTLGTVNNGAPVLGTAMEMLSALPVRVLAAIGADGDPELLGPQPPNVTIERWVPQASVLEHCDAVVSHAGSGTFLGALSAGLPQLCLPQAADQFRNSAAGVRVGAALALNPDEATGDDIAKLVLRLLNESSFREAAVHVATETASMPDPADVVGVLSALVAEAGGSAGRRRTGGEP